MYYKVQAILEDIVMRVLYAFLQRELFIQFN